VKPKPKLVARRTLAERLKVLECICDVERTYRTVLAENPSSIERAPHAFAVFRAYVRFRRLVLREIR